MTEGKSILRSNQYPEYWYENIIYKTLEKIKMGQKKAIEEEDEERRMLFIQYRGAITDHFVKKLRDFGAPVKPILTIRK